MGALLLRACQLGCAVLALALLPADEQWGTGVVDAPSSREPPQRAPTGGRTAWLAPGRCRAARRPATELRVQWLPVHACSGHGVAAVSCNHRADAVRGSTGAARGIGWPLDGKLAGRLRRSLRAADLAVPRPMRSAARGRCSLDAASRVRAPGAAARRAAGLLTAACAVARRVAARSGRAPSGFQKSKQDREGRRALGAVPHFCSHRAARVTSRRAPPRALRARPVRRGRTCATQRAQRELRLPPV